ncbi:MAG: ABC transporter permease [Spirochaetota bacterium]
MDNHTTSITSRRGKRRLELSRISVGKIIPLLIGINILIMATLSFLSPTFLTYGNLTAVMTRMSELAVLAIAETIVLISGGFDLTVGAVMALTGALCSKLYVAGLHFPLVIFLSIASGVAVGALNAFLVVSLRLQPFIVTLATMSIVRSLVYGLLKGIVFTDFPERYLNLGYIYILKIPLLFIIVIAMAIIMIVMLRKTIIGRYIFAVGANERAAYISGIYVNRVKFLVYTLSGFICALGGLLFTIRIRAAIPDAGINAPLEVITAVLIGGTAITGGKGSILGSLLGVFAMFLLLNGFNLLGLNPFWNVIILGVILIYVIGQESILHPLRLKRRGS